MILIAHIRNYPKLKGNNRPNTSDNLDTLNSKQDANNLQVKIVLFMR